MHYPITHRTSVLPVRLLTPRVLTSQHAGTQTSSRPHAKLNRILVVVCHGRCYPVIGSHRPTPQNDTHPRQRPREWRQKWKHSSNDFGSPAQCQRIYQANVFHLDKASRPNASHEVTQPGQQVTAFNDSSYASVTRARKRNSGTNMLLFLGDLRDSLIT